MAAHRYEEAVGLLQRVITQNPQDPRPRCLLAICLLNTGKAKEAAEMAGSAIALDPHAEWPHRIRSLALAAMGKKIKAVHEAEEAVRADPNQAMALFVLGERLLHRPWRLKQAAEVVRRGLALAPDGYVGHELLARIELRRKRWKEAEVAYRKALGMQPQSWVLMNNLALALKGQGREREAIEMFENAARANPRSTVARRNLYLATRRYAGLGLFALVVLVNVARFLIGAYKDSPLGLAMVALILVSVTLLLVVLKRRRTGKLSLTTRTFYKAESHRELVNQGPFIAVWMAGAFGVIVLSLMTYPSLQNGALILMVGGVLAWFFVWRYLWITLVRAWVEAHF